MKQLTPIILLVFAILITLFSFIGDDSFTHLGALKEQLQYEQRQNEALSATVSDLKTQVVGLQNDPRVLEKAARNELGMVRDDEVVFIFEEKSSEK